VAGKQLGLPAWPLPLGIAIWQLVKYLRSRRGAAQIAEAVGTETADSPLEEVLLPATDRVWELYDEDTVEGLHAASEDPMLMAELMRE